VLDGRVAGVNTFGLFVNVGVADGLVHRSQITSDKGVEPTVAYRPGDAVRVLVTAVDPSAVAFCCRSSASKRIPGSARAGTFAPARRRPSLGSCHTALSRVPSDIEGLIHVSEIAVRRIGSPGEVLHPGDVVRVRVVAIDPHRRRRSLSIRQASGNVVYETRTDQDANV
jgi:small subunit ribosomal protein S1